MAAAALLHNEIAERLRAVPVGPTNADTLEAKRRIAYPGPPLSDEVDRRDVVIASDPRVSLRIHRPKGVEGHLPCLYSMHGGGYVMGTVDMDDARFDKWCRRFSCVGVSVDYSLAPEVPYPGPLEDCYTGLRWLHDNAEELGIDRHRIGVGGGSAGGGLAAALALLARDRGEVPLRFQVLECPMLDDRQSTPSSQLDDLAIWTRESSAFGWQSYLGHRYGSDDVPVYAAAARASDLAGLPPAYVAVGTADGYRDEDITYAMRLNQAGVPTELHVYPGLPHGHHLFRGVPAVAQWQRDLEDWVARQLGSGVD